MAIQYRAALHETGQEDQVNAEAVPTMGSFITFVFFADHTKRAEREINLQKMVAAFDVDGSCLVVTPFDSDMERLPHPALRSMATAWVVKRELDDKEQIETQCNGSLSCEGSLSLNGAQKDCKGKGKGKEKAVLEESDYDIAGCGLKDSDHSPRDIKLSVTHRVRGVWEITDESLHKYTFV